MRAVIDIGTNTIRMLLGDCRNGILAPESYHRQITRLGGNFSPQTGLSAASMDRALVTLQSYQDIIDAAGVSQVRAVATAALRSANNRDFFLAAVVASTGINIEVIIGEEEARLTTLGVLSVIDPIPKSAIVIDIGGGSTELICIVDGKNHLQKSYPLGVVSLCEGYTSAAQRQLSIDAVILQFSQSLQQVGMAEIPFQLIGTAGTITTLAAIHLQLKEYNQDLINNHVLTMNYLYKLRQELELISVPERERIIGMEAGRGDLILPGLQILLTLMQQFQFSTIKVSDCGLLEGLMLQLTEP
jgi:exopolyphosphatase/guanosine-5'-triphosphate,3'-diphosphate pyrophosphatase